MRAPGRAVTSGLGAPDGPAPPLPFPWRCWMMAQKRSMSASVMLSPRPRPCMACLNSSTLLFSLAMSIMNSATAFSEICRWFSSSAVILFTSCRYCSFLSCSMSSSLLTNDGCNGDLSTYSYGTVQPQTVAARRRSSCHCRSLFCFLPCSSFASAAVASGSCVSSRSSAPSPQRESVRAPRVSRGVARRGVAESSPVPLAYDGKAPTRREKHAARRRAG
mmetsp:Transcript_19587/g.58074  ORF Transcript_19587/g.58074 Transcript_19587/m.58074 type:complete len:219 (+) Transcript_19587:335-991(+)